MKGQLTVASLVFATLAMTYAANADDAAAAKPISKTLGELLTEGYQVHSVTVIDQATAKRMSGSDAWQDDLMLTLVKGGDFAFCNFALSVVMTGVGLKSGNCSVAQ